MDATIELAKPFFDWSMGWEAKELGVQERHQTFLRITATPSSLYSLSAIGSLLPYLRVHDVAYCGACDQVSCL